MQKRKSAAIQSSPLTGVNCEVVSANVMLAADFAAQSLCG